MSILYSWPASLAYRGLGELTVGITFGPLLMLGTYVVQTGQLSDRPLIYGIPLGILIAAVLWINEFPDVEADRRAGKYNLVVRLGKARARVYFALIMALAMASVAGVAAYFASPWLLLGLVGAVEAFNAARVCWREYRVTAKMVPANASTVKTCVLTGIGMLIGTLIG